MEGGASVNIARVFPSRTSLTPTDGLAFVGEPPSILSPDIDEVHISVTFTWDLEEAHRLQPLWEQVAPTKIGGPATGMGGGDFTPGMYLREGVTITSRGCPNRCWFCSVWKRHPEGLTELEIQDGWIIHDDNFLACSREHILAVAEMLERQPHRADFRGLEAKLLEPWHVELFRDLNPEKMFFAYDTPDDWDPLVRATEMLSPYFDRHQLYCYVLIGYPRDTMEKAQERLEAVKSLGICPFAMLYKDHRGETDLWWRRFQRMWCRPATIYAKERADPIKVIEYWKELGTQRAALGHLQKEGGTR